MIRICFFDDNWSLCTEEMMRLQERGYPIEAELAPEVWLG